VTKASVRLSSSSVPGNLHEVAVVLTSRCATIRLMESLRSAAELASVPSPAWPTIEELIDKASAPVQVLPVAEPDGMDCVHRLQVTASSTLGGLALNCGELLVDHPGSEYLEAAARVCRAWSMPTDSQIRRLRAARHRCSSSVTTCSVVGSRSTAED
jgi:hypothetical protein